MHRVAGSRAKKEVITDETNPQGPNKGKAGKWSKKPRVERVMIIAGAAVGACLVGSILGFLFISGHYDHWGTAVSRFSSGYWFSPSASVADGLVYVGSCDNNLYALDAGTRAKRWSFEKNVKSKWFSSPAVVDGVAYHVTFDSTLYAIGIDDGTVLWEFDADGKLSRSPAVKGGIVAISTSQSHLYAVEAETGKKIWDIKSEGVVYSHPAIAGNLLYWGSGDQHMYALDLASGDVLWKFEAQGAVGSPTPHDGLILFCADENLYVLH